MSVQSVWVGDSTCYGYYASTLEGRYSSITSRAMGWDETNLSVPGSGYTVPGTPTFGEQLASAVQSVPDPQLVDWVLIMGGVNDAGWNRDISAVATAVSEAVRQARTLFPRARVVVGVEPTVYSKDANLQQARMAMAKAIQDAAGKVADLVIPGMMDVCRDNASLRSDEWHPNTKGHRLIADYILSYLGRYDPDGPDTQDDEDVRRRYGPGRADPAANAVRDRVRGMREKDQAGMPTGTETDQTSAKLKAAIAQLKAQQQQLERQQKQLETQQDQLKAQQDQIRGMLDQLKAQHDQLQLQHNQLTAIVGSQGSTVSQLQQITSSLASQEALLQRVQQDLYAQQTGLIQQYQQLSDRVQRLEQNR